MFVAILQQTYYKKIILNCANYRKINISSKLKKISQFQKDFVSLSTKTDIT